METRELIARKLDTLPDKPGVYLWKNAAGEILYVGKAKSLRARVPSYLGPDAASTPERAALARQIADVETIVVPSEPQALLLENNLIKEYRPRFNIPLTRRQELSAHRGDPGGAVPPGPGGSTRQHPRSAVFRPLHRRGDAAPNAERSSGAFSPFGPARGHLPADAPDRPCLDYHIDRCKAPCVGYQTREEYGRMIEDVLVFLEGKTVDVRSRLRDRMQNAAGEPRFRTGGRSCGMR